MVRWFGRFGRAGGISIHSSLDLVSMNHDLFFFCFFCLNDDALVDVDFGIYLFFPEKKKFWFCLIYRLKSWARSGNIFPFCFAKCLYNQHSYDIHITCGDVKPMSRPAYSVMQLSTEALHCQEIEEKKKRMRLKWMKRLIHICIFVTFTGLSFCRCHLYT